MTDYFPSGFGFWMTTDDNDRKILDVTGNDAIPNINVNINSTVDHNRCGDLTDMRVHTYFSVTTQIFGA